VATALVATLASLANGAARQCTLVANPLRRKRAKITVRLKSGAAAPTAGALYELYLIRSNGTDADDGAGAADAAITIENALLIGSIVVTASAAKIFRQTITTPIDAPLGATWGIAVKNSSGQALSATELDHALTFDYVEEE
jgi:hypothetical protein